MLQKPHYLCLVDEYTVISDVFKSCVFILWQCTGPRAAASGFYRSDLWKYLFERRSPQYVASKWYSVLFAIGIYHSVASKQKEFWNTTWIRCEEFYPGYKSTKKHLTSINYRSRYEQKWARSEVNAEAWKETSDTKAGKNWEKVTDNGSQCGEKTSEKAANKAANEREDSAEERDHDVTETRSQ